MFTLFNKKIACGNNPKQFSKWYSAYTFLYQNNKGVILIASYAIAMVLLIVTGAIVSRTIVQTRAVQREKDALEALYAAEKGVEYAVIEYNEYNRLGYGWNWCTHYVDINDIDGDGDNTELMFNPLPIILQGTILDDYGDADPYTGCYRLNTPYGVVRVKVYPAAGRVIILSQATVGRSTKTIEYHLARASLYKYLYFYPYTTTFGRAIYNGRGYGGIHVNGDIRVSGNNYFYYLSELSCSGYIKRPWGKFYDSGRYGSEQGFGSSYISPMGLRSDVINNINYRFNRGTTHFRTGPEESYTQTKLPWYLEGGDASWEFDKYRGTDPGYSVHFNISDKNLKDMAIYEMWRSKGSEALFDNSKTLTVTYQDGTPAKPNLPEEEAFETAYIDELNGKEINWQTFWTHWQSNHNNDYSSYSGLGGKDWERKYWMARYNRTNPESWYGVNQEWWQDLSYADDRHDGTLTDDMAEAEYVDWYTEDSFTPKRYLLNTEEQGAVWEDWIENTDDGALDGIVQDRTLGGVNLEPPNYMKAFEDAAKGAGIYIGTDEDDNPVNDLSGLDIIEEKEFYNSSHPARDESNKYAPSKVLQIDVAKLKEKIEDGTIPNYNGEIYVNLEDYWGGTKDAKKAYAVKLHNAEALPDEGITLVTPNNVFIKGNYNLDPNGDEEKNRPADDSAVIDRVISSKDYISSQDDLNWQPSSIITNRLVYTLSEDYPEPSYMPMPYHFYYEYYDEKKGYSSYDYVDHPRWGTPDADWMPDPADTHSTSIDNYFAYSGESRPSEWTKDWIESHWGTYNNKTVLKYDTDDDGLYDAFVSCRDLTVDLYYKVYYKFSAAFSYDNIHPGGANPNTPSRANYVRDKHIYNTAVVTPYSPETYSLEYWSASRTINGSFIQLPEKVIDPITKKVLYIYKKSIPGSSYVSGYRRNSPSSRYEYESRFGGGQPQTPPGDFFAGASGGSGSETSCWRIVDNSRF